MTALTGTSRDGSTVGTRAVGRSAQAALITLPLLLFLAVTNHWPSWQQSITTFQMGDDVDYRAMANAAPGLPHHVIAQWRAERFPVQWVVGSTAKLFSVSVVDSYRVFDTLAILAIWVLLADLLVRIGLSRRGTLLCMGLYALSPYTLRPYLIGPEAVADVVFVLGGAIAVRGLVLFSPAALLGGLVLATVARQTAVPPALVAAGVILIDPRWRERLGRRQWLWAAAVVGLPVALYAGVTAGARSFSGPAPTIDQLTLLGASSSTSYLAQHFARCATGLLAAAALMGTLGWARRIGRHARSTAARPAESRATIWACLAFAGAIAVQPLVMNPTWADMNEIRLTVLGLLPLVVAFALMLRDEERDRGGPLAAGAVASMLVVLAIGSFHEFRTVISTGGKVETFVLELVSALALAGLAWRALSIRRETRTTPPPLSPPA